MQYSFLEEGVLQKIGKFVAPKGVERLLNYSAAGTLIGSSTGGLIGFLYGVKVYKSRRKTLMAIENKINDPETSAYSRRQLIDAQNLIMSMTDEEYRNYVIKDYYQKGVAVGGTAGTFLGTMLSKR
jgi:hypothetical protein